MKYVLIAVAAFESASAHCGVEGKDTDCPFRRQLHGGTPDKTQTTVKGCKCTSQCGGSVTQKFYKQDWCKTRGTCGTWLGWRYSRWVWTTWYSGHYVHQYYDYCSWPKRTNPIQNSLTWRQKKDALWRLITKDPIDTSKSVSTPKILKSAVKTLFESEWDVLPAGWQKFNHQHGAVAPFVLRITNSEYTGLLKDGEQHGFLRFSNSKTVESGNMQPNIGVKFPRTGQKSGNWVAMERVAEGGLLSGSKDYFNTTISNHIPIPEASAKLRLGNWKFCQATECTTAVGLSDVTKYDQDGNEAKTNVFPWKVAFEPTGAVNLPNRALSLKEFLGEFTKIPKGTEIYRFRTFRSPTDTVGVISGVIELTEKPVTSKFGDEHLMFPHQNMEEDLRLMPGWAAGGNQLCNRAECKKVWNPFK